MFTVKVTLIGSNVEYKFLTKAEADAFMAGVSSAISWPRKSHKGMTLVETKKPVVPVAPPVVREVEGDKS